ncbi:MAG: protease inhibitor I42 family protein [Bacteroidota bacterium]
MSFFLACSSLSETATEKPEAGPSGKLIEAGKVTRVQHGEELVVALQTDDGKGYEWRYSQSDSSVLEFVELQAESHDAAAEDDRAPSDYYFVWKAKAPGQTALTFHYVLPWQSGDQPLKTLKYEVVVE